MGLHIAGEKPQGCKDCAALRALGDLQFFLAAQAGDLQLDTQACLRNADGNGAVQVGAATLEVGMLLHIEDNVQIASWSAIGPGLAFALHAQAGAGIDAGRNAQLDDSFLLHASLTAAFNAALFDDLAGALASGASARDGEKSLLIGELAPAGASLASDYSGAGFRSRAVAGG